MSALAAWRREIRALIPRGFLRRDQGEALFISDYPRFSGGEAVTARLRAAGWRVAVAGQTARIDGTEETYRALLRALPCPDAAPNDDTLYLCSLARRLIRAETPAEAQPLEGMPGLLKLLEQGRLDDAARETAAFAALCQRRGDPLPSAAGKLLLLALQEREGENSPC